jgi:hypothetical protein
MTKKKRQKPIPTSPLIVETDPTDAQKLRPEYRRNKNGTWRTNRMLPLDYYFKQGRGGINEPQHRAGMMLHELFHKSGMYRIATPGYWYMGEELGTRIQSSGGREEFRLDLFDRTKNAMLAASGIAGRRIVESVCCYDLYLKDIDVLGYETGEFKMRRLREALDDLVDHFNVPIPHELQHHYSRRWSHEHTKEAHSNRRP